MPTEIRLSSQQRENMMKKIFIAVILLISISGLAFAEPSDCKVPKAKIVESFKSITAINKNSRFKEGQDKIALVTRGHRNNYVFDHVLLYTYDGSHLLSIASYGSPVQSNTWKVLCDYKKPEVKINSVDYPKAITTLAVAKRASKEDNNYELKNSKYATTPKYNRFPSCKEANAWSDHVFSVAGADYNQTFDFFNTASDETIMKFDNYFLMKIKQLIEGNRIYNDATATHAESYTICKDGSKELAARIYSLVWKKKRR